MNRMPVILLLSVVLAASAHAVQAENRFVSSELGISLDVPLSRDTEVTNYQVAAFFLPPIDNFSANVNIQKQRYSDSIKAYDELTMNQFGQFKLTVLSHTIQANEVRYEYKGELQGRPLHWYARAISSGGFVYLVTGTSLEAKWEQQKSTLIRSVDSFTVKG